MATAARANIEALLRARKLDTTLASEQSSACLAEAAQQRRRDDEFVVATGIAALDERLGGGFARGQMSEIVGARSSGRTSVAVSAMAGAAARGELVALVDSFDTFDPASARACGLDLSRLLWVRGRSERPKSEVRSPKSAQLMLTPDVGPRTSDYGEGQAIDHAVKALNLILQAGGFGLVVLDLADASRAAIRRLPFTTWFRLQRPIEGSATACVLLAAEPTARSAGGVTVGLRRAEPVDGRQPRWGALFGGFDVEARIARARGIADACQFSCAATPLP